MLGTIGSPSCCAVTELLNLYEYDKPKDALIQYLKSRQNGANNVKPYIGPYVLFTGVVHCDAPYHSEDNGGCLVLGTYAGDFAKFLVTNKLGQVCKMPKRRNRVTTPHHTVEAYMWLPCPDALQEWWTSNKPSKNKFKGKK